MSREHTSDEDYEDDKVVETGPNGTYVRFEHKLGSGAFKTVYRALDTERGIEVAWNQVLIERFQLDKEKVLREIEFFKKIRHKHVIDFYNFWTDEKKNQVVFITELMPSGTLTNYIDKSPEVKLKIIKSWCKQILLGLNYLHTRDPPIIHRDIKCGNIFINGTTEGQVKIGDLGLATFCLKKDALSVIGTPEFMAPEYYNEVYTTSVDIWAFGMAMIEMVTLQCPYAECDNVGQIFKKVSGGVRPQQLEYILDPDVKNFIKLCLKDEKDRPTAAQLLQHSFFETDGVNDNNPVRRADPSTFILQQPLPVIDPIHLVPTVGEPVAKTAPQITINPPQDETTTELVKEPELKKTENSAGSFVSFVNRFDMRVVQRTGDMLQIEAEMGIVNEHDNTEEASKIDFCYNLANDDPKKTAAEMVRSLELDHASYQLIFSAFADLVKDNDREQAMTELSELVSHDLDELLVPQGSGYDDSDSIHSEPMLATPSSSKFPASGTNNTVVSDPETVDDLYELESLVEEGEDNYTPGEISQSNLQDNTDLEDLLDDDDFVDDAMSEHSFGTRSSFDSSPVKTILDDDDDTVGSSTSSGNTSEDGEDEEIMALKAKHAADLRRLLEIQENELRVAQEDMMRKKQMLAKDNVDYHESALELKSFYDQQQKHRNSGFRKLNDWSPLCI